VQTGAGQVIVWLSPDMIDLKRRVSVSVNGRGLLNTADLVPNLETLLEDARTRGDRLHPFWAKVETPGGRAVASP